MIGASARRLAAALVAAAGAAGCASAPVQAPAAVDLAGARQAVEEARGAGAAEHAAEALARAEGRLLQAEALARRDSAAERQRAQCLAEVSTSEARCALERALEATAPRAASPAPASPDEGALRARLARTEAERARLTEQAALLARELELAENEVIRSKARLRGGATKAEATAAIAEARVLTQRLARPPARAEALARAEGALRRAEEQLAGENYGAAIFFALRAQDTASAGLETGAAPAPARDARVARSTYTVRVGLAKLRGGPGLGRPVVGRAPRGARLEALGEEGEWVKVRYGALEGWVHRSLVE